jgi:hypothetical protein
LFKGCSFAEREHLLDDHFAVAALAGVVAADKL